LGTISAFAFRHRKTKKNLWRLENNSCNTDEEDEEEEYDDDDDVEKEEKLCPISVRFPVYEDFNQPFVLTPRIILISLRKKALAKEQELLFKFMKFQYEYSALEPPVVNYLERYVDIRRTSHDCILFPT